MFYQDLERELDQLLKLEDWREQDGSQNGLQVQPGKQHEKLKKIAFAVDANQLTFELAAAAKADLLFVHHGLFWGNSPLLTGWYYQRVKILLDSGCGLYACHLPLDAHPKLGNNVQLAGRLQLKKLKPVDVGVSGDLPVPATIEGIVNSLGIKSDDDYDLLAFGKKKINRVAIISGGGGAPQYVAKAAATGAQLYLTGEVGHQTYQYAREAQINVLGLGHYWTETFGPQAVRAYVQKNFKLEAVWLDAPTGY